MLRVGVMVSGGGTNLQAILDAVDAGEITKDVHNRSAVSLLRHHCRRDCLYHRRHGNVPDPVFSDSPCVGRH